MIISNGMDRKRLFKHLTLLIILIFVVNFFANKFYWYSSIWFFDMVMHFVGGFWLGLVYLYFFAPTASFPRFVSGMLLFVLVVGLGWEVFEISVNEVLTRNPFNFRDTVSDIFFDLLGGLCAILYIWKKP